MWRDVGADIEHEVDALVPGRRTSSKNEAGNFGGQPVSGRFEALSACVLVLCSRENAWIRVPSEFCRGRSVLVIVWLISWSACYLSCVGLGWWYVLGAVETFLTAVPTAVIFRESVTNVNATTIGQDAVTQTISTPSLHDLQIYGIVVTILLCFVVFGGVKTINRVAPAFLIPVLFSLLCIFIGIFSAPRHGAPDGITGLRFNTFRENWTPDYKRTNRAGIPLPDGTIFWNFNALVGLFFPAVTGIMAGSNRSASLKDTQRSIPIGTLSATLVTSGLYIISVLLFGSLATREKLLTDRLLTATVAWPGAAVVQIGIILSTLGAALQSLTGAPNLLAAIANDDILPVLKYFRVSDGGDPHFATLFTAFICICCVIIGNLDLITPTITMFFLLCYSGVNLSCFLLDLLDAPSWRPRWKYHHWSLSLLGATLCVVIMFLISWFLLPSRFDILLREYQRKSRRLGRWFQECLFSTSFAEPSFVRSRSGAPEELVPYSVDLLPTLGQVARERSMPSQAGRLTNCMKKKGRGMSIFFSILDGDYYEKAEEAKNACRQLSTYIDYKHCEGVAEIIVAPSMSEGFCGIVQTMGLGNLKPNIVVMRYPEISTTFVSIINDCIVANKAVVIVKGLDEWPGEYQKQYGTIDLYWIMRDGGLMLLLSQLLLTKASFESCKIQVFCIAEEDAEAEELKADVRKFLYDLRMQAEVIVVTMGDVNVEGRKEDESVEAFMAAQKRISEQVAQTKKKLAEEGKSREAMGVDGSQVNKFLYTTLKLNSTILRYSRMAAVVLVSLPPPPINHPSYFYME